MQPDRRWSDADWQLVEHIIATHACRSSPNPKETPMPADPTPALPAEAQAWLAGYRDGLGGPTSAEIEAGVVAFLRAFPFAHPDESWARIVERHPAFVDAARRAVRAVLRDHDARIRADERRKVAEEFIASAEAEARRWGHDPAAEDPTERVMLSLPLIRKLISAQANPAAHIRRTLTGEDTP